MNMSAYQIVDVRNYEYRDPQRAQRAERVATQRRIDSVLRILKDRSTPVEEAVRMGVDVDTVSAWVSTTLAAISRAMQRDATALSAMPERQLASA